MILRSYEERDEESVIQLWSDCGLITPQNDPVLDIERKLTRDPEWFLIGELDYEIIASCMVGYDGHRGWINYLAVSPSRQRNGHAERIMKRAEGILRGAGCAKINLQVRSTNVQVIEFYERIAYVIDDVVSMGKRLVYDENERDLQVNTDKN